jgi:hypothetical protein
VEHEERADELLEEADKVGEASDQLKGEIEGARSDWESKKGDQKVPGALEEGETGVAESDAPATGEGEPEEENVAGEGGGGPA